MKVTSNTVKGHDITTMYLEFEDGSLDTIKTQIDRPTSNSTFVTKVWYNGTLRWDVSDKNLSEHPNDEYVKYYFIVTHNVE